MTPVELHHQQAQHQSLVRKGEVEGVADIAAEVAADLLVVLDRQALSQQVLSQQVLSQQVLILLILVQVEQHLAAQQSNITDLVALPKEMNWFCMIGNQMKRLCSETQVSAIC